MEFVVSPHTYVLTVEGYIQAKLLQENPNTIVKSLLISPIDDQSFKVERIDYGTVVLEPYTNELGQKVNSLKVVCPYVSHAVIYAKPIDEVYLLSSTDAKFHSYDTIDVGFHFMTIVKHMIVDLSILKFTSSTIHQPLLLSAHDLPSITFSSDENGTATLTFFNKLEA